MEIAFVRHGSTDWNRDRRFQGQSDVPLSVEGRDQAQALARVLSGIPFDYAVSSDLSRAYDTARAIRKELPVVRDTRWREFDFGQWEGLTWDQILERWPQTGEHAHTAAKTYAPEDGERFDAVCARVSEAIDDLRRGGHEQVLVVTHAGPLHAMLHALFGDRAQAQEIMGVRFSPASITRVNLQPDGTELLVLNDISHLPRA
jgi:alpha-ribazole phosphatase